MLLLISLIFFSFGGYIYFYKKSIVKFILKKLFLISIYFLKLYYKYKYKKQDDSISKDSKNHNEYNIVQDNKTFNVILNKSDLQEFKRNIKCYLHDRNLIVHCSIINELGDILIDTTNCFRKFSFYFKTDQTLLIFNEYLQTKYPDIFYGNGNYLVLYLNHFNSNLFKDFLSILINRNE